MNYFIEKSSFEKIKEGLLININERVSYFDSFLEDHIMKSVHYEISLDGVQIGYFSIFDTSLARRCRADKGENWRLF